MLFYKLGKYCYVYISGSSVRTAIDFLIKERSRLVKTKRLMVSKALKFVGKM